MKKVDLTRSAALCLIYINLCHFSHAKPKILKPIATEEATRKLSHALNTFGLDLYEHLIKENDNIVFSPFGISLLMSAISIGARGRTATEINNTLHYENITLEEMTTAFHDVFLEENLVGYEMDMYKAVVIQNGIHVDPNFKDIVERLMLVEAKSVNFKNISTYKNLNKYVSEGSQGKIPKLFSEPLDSSTLVLLVNGMAFSGVWLKQFEINDTYESEFFNKGSKVPKKVIMMHIKCTFEYTDNEELHASILKLPYDEEEGFMILILPRSKDGLAIVQQELTLEHLQNAIESLKPTLVSLTLPKFTIRNTFGMKPVLKELGIKRAFSKKTADFFGLLGVEDLSLADVFQTNTIDVNEKGTLATTGEVVIPRTQIGMDGVSFKVDHPFMYLIMDKNTNMTFFIGHIIQL